MSPMIIAAEDFLNDELKSRIEATAARLGFSVRFYESGEEVGDEIADAEIVFGSGFNNTLRLAKSLKWFCCSFAGVEPYLKEEAWPHPDCLFTNSSGAYGVTISEHIVMVLLMMLRRMPEYQQEMARHHWPVFEPIRSVRGLRVTILGTGDIGTHTARSLSAMGAEVRGVRRDPSKASDPAFREMWATDDLDRLLPDTETLIMALPSTASTRGILSRERIALLPEGAYVINVGRGTAIDQDALIDALNTGHLAGAGLDVMVPEPLPDCHPLWNAKNILLTPHCSGNTALDYSKDRVVEMFLEDLEHYAKGIPLLHTVDRRIGY